MKKILLLLCSFLLLGGSNSVWADRVYFNDFESEAKRAEVTIKGNGQWEDDANPRFGKIFHNDPTLTKAVRTNYLELPSDVLSHSATTKEMTITFWVNVKNAADYWFSPIFTAYGNDNATESHAWPDSWWPFLHVQSRGILAWNSDGYCDFTAEQNDNGANQESTVWLDDSEWHLYTLTLTSSTAKIYIDGKVFNSWTIAENGLEGFFTQTSLTHFYLGGNQAFGWDDPDPAYGFDDFAVYDAALTAEQIAQIINKKGIIGKTDCSTYYLTDMTEKMTLKQGESYHYHFVNHNTPTNANAWNWVLPVYNSGNANAEIVLRSDNWEDKENKDSDWGSNAGCWLRSNGSDDVWADYMNQMNGATVDMTISYTYNKVIKVDCDITTSSDYSWKYTYTSDYTGSTRSFTGDVQLALSVSNSWLEVLEEGYSAVSKTITSAKWATYCSPYALDFSSDIENLTAAYIVTGVDNGALTLLEVDGTVPANTGLLLKGEGACTIPVAASSSTDVSDNKLVGVTSSQSLPAEEGYVLMGSPKVGFYKNTKAFTLGANTAYLPDGFDSVGPGARAAFYGFDEDDAPTAINAIEAADAKGNGLKDGKYLIDSKIVIVKNGVKYSANGQILK